MHELSMIKSYPHGLTLILNPDADFEQVARDVCVKFASSRSFFGNEDTVISIEGRDLTDEETEAIIQSVEYNSDLLVSVVIDRDETRDRRMVRSLERFYTESVLDFAKVIYGSVENGEKIESGKSIVVLGDVMEDAVVTAAGNVFVWGKVCGTVIAGAAGDNSAIIVAGDLCTSVAGIGRYSRQIEIDKKTGFFQKYKAAPSVLKVEGTEIEIHPFSPEEVRVSES